MSCIDIAYYKYQQRKDIDTHPIMARTGAHWYYRSDQLIFNPIEIPDLSPAYVGPPEKALPAFFGQGTWEEDKETLNDWIDGGWEDLSDLEKEHIRLICSKEKVS